MAKGVKMKNTGVSTYILLDRSGSMQNMWHEAVGSINAYIKTLKETETDGDKITIAVFDDSYDVVVDDVKLKDLEEITTDISYPRGMTALFDSTGKLINAALSQKPEKAVIVIMTDGGENNSREFNKDAVTALIKKAEKKEYQVIFLGANFDVSRDAQLLGVDQTKFFKSSVKGLSANMGDLANRTRCYASASFGSAESNIGYTFEDKSLTEGDGIKK